MKALIHAKTMPYRVILASKSPRRRELLAKLGFPYEVIPARGEEEHTGNDFCELAMHLAKQKALEVYEMVNEQGDTRTPLLVIGADTIVVYQNELLCKPKDAKDAFRMLSMLSGNTHKVYTGVSFCFHTEDAPDVMQTHTFVECTDVMFEELTAPEIDAYIASGDPFDKAGAYGIQGEFAIHVKGICGDYNNVVGLPIARVYHELRKLNILYFM